MAPVALVVTGLKLVGLRMCAQYRRSYYSILSSRQSLYIYIYVCVCVCVCVCVLGCVLSRPAGDAAASTRRTDRILWLGTGLSSCNRMLHRIQAFHALKPSYSATKIKEHPVECGHFSFTLSLWSPLTIAMIRLLNVFFLRSFRQTRY